MATSDPFNECITKLSSFQIEGECVKLVVSKLIGIVIVVLSCSMKLPQIKVMLSSTSESSKLSEVSAVTDILSYLLIVLYNLHHNYPFNTYGENFTVLIQNFVILVLFFRSTKSGLFRILYSSATVLFTAVCLHDKYVPEYLWAYIGTGSLPIIVISRVSTIIYLFNAKNPGPLSSFTFILAVGGCFTRILTTLAETGDKVLLLNLGVSLILNATILIQIFVYSGNNTKVSEKENDKTKDKNTSDTSVLGSVIGEDKKINAKKTN